MSVSLCPTFGIGYQGFTAGGIPLNAGLLYTYVAGGTTPQATYTTSAGNVSCANPIVLSSDGRPSTEIWLTDGQSYRLDLKDSLGNLIKTYDNVTGGSITSGVLAASGGSALVGFLQGGTGAVLETVQAKLRQAIDLADFGVVGDGSDEYVKVRAALTAAVSQGVRTVTAHGMTVSITTSVEAAGQMDIVFTGGAGFKALAPFVTTTDLDGNQQGMMLRISGANVTAQGLTIDADNIVSHGMIGIWGDSTANYTNIRNCLFKNIKYKGGGQIAVSVNIRSANDCRVEFCNHVECCAGPVMQNSSRSIINGNKLYSRTDGNAGGTTGIMDTGYAFDGTGTGCRITNNIAYYNANGQITSCIGITSKASDWVISGNSIIGINSGSGINIDEPNGVGANSPSYGLIANNYIDGRGATVGAGGVVFTNFCSLISIDQTAGSVSSNIEIAGNTLRNPSVGAFTSSIGIKSGTAAMTIHDNVISVAGSATFAAIFITPTTGGGYCTVQNNVIAATSDCIRVDGTGANNNGKPIWIKNNHFSGAALGIHVIQTGGGTLENVTPVYHQDNEYNDCINGVSNSGGVVLGTRWDPAFKGLVHAGTFPHYCAVRTAMLATAIPDATWVTGGGSFQQGDQFWKIDPASGATPGWVCTTAGTGATGTFKAMANLA